MEQRIRSEYNIRSQTITVESYPISCSNRNWFHNGNGGAYLEGESRTMLDYVTPRFHSRSAKGERFFNDMYKEEVTVSDAGSGCLFHSISNVCSSPSEKAQTRVGTGYVAALTPRGPINSKGHALPLLATAISNSEIERLKAAVSTEVWGKIGTSSAEMWETVAQYRQTLAMFNDPLNRLKDLSKRLLKGAETLSASRQLMKEVSDGYLMARYGISPLVRDIKELAGRLVKDGGHMEVTSRARETLSASSVVAGMNRVGSLDAHWLRQVSDTVTIRGMHLDRGYVSMANNLGFDFRGLALLPLQLTSYSFVADWFVNLSSYVKSTIPAFGWQPLGGCLVIERNTTTVYGLTSVVNNNPSGITLVSAPTGHSRITSKSTTRLPLVPPQLVVNSNFRFDEFTRVADALGLIGARFAKVSALIGGPKQNKSAFRNRKAFEHWASQPDVKYR